MLFAVPCLLAAQGGRYYFIEFTTADSPKGREAVTAGGTLTIAPGACAVVSRAARNAEAAKPVSPKLTCTQDGAGRLTMDSPSGMGGTLKLAMGEGNKAIVGSGSKPGAHTFFVAITAPDAGATAPVATNGLYHAAWLQVQPLAPRGLTSGLASFPFAERRMGELATLVSHSTEFDDVARRATFPLPKVEISPAGAGTISFAPPGLEIPLRGTREIMFSPDGSYFLAWSTAAGPRDILVGLRADPDASASSWMGSFAIAELTASVPYELNAKPAALSSAFGTARNAGGGFLELEESLWDGKTATNLVTRNAYRVGSDGSSMLGATVVPNQTNLGIGGGTPTFNGVLIGPLNVLSLDHGIFFGVRLSQEVPPVPAALTATHADGSPVEASKPARFGESISIAVPNYKAGPTRVMIDGVDAPSKPGSPLTVTVPKLKRAGNVPLAVSAPGLVHDVTDLPVQP